MVIGEIGGLRHHWCYTGKGGHFSASQGSNGSPKQDPEDQEGPNPLIMSQLIILEDLFAIASVDAEGKKFDRVSRIKATGENLGMDLVLDINSEIYPVKQGDRLNIALAKTLNLDGSPSDEGSYRPDATGPSLADKYDYVMYGRLFKFENTSNANKM